MRDLSGGVRPGPAPWPCRVIGGWTRRAALGGSPVPSADYATEPPPALARSNNWRSSRRSATGTFS